VGGKGVSMRYKVSFSGFAYVEADSKEEAEEKALDGETVYEETEIVQTEEVDEFTVRI